MVWDSCATNRRGFLKASGAASIAFVAGCTESIGSNEFPNQPITFKVIADTGGGYDYYTRLIAKYIRENDLLSVDTKIENLTMSLIGRFNNIYNSEADGYTYGNVWPGFARMQAQGLDAVKFDISKITPMASAGGNLRAMAVSSDLDVKTPRELIELIASGKAKFYTTGVRSTGTIVPVLFGELSGEYGLKKVMNNYVVYEGQAQGITGIKRGDVNVMCGSLSSIIPYIKSGDIRPILVLTTEKSVPELYKKNVGDAQPLAAVDVKNKKKIEGLTSYKNYWNFCGPPDIPEERANVVREAMEKAIKKPGFKKEANKNSRVVDYTGSEALSKDLTNKLDLWKEWLPLLKEMEKAAQG